jgi:hypothetical protein
MRPPTFNGRRRPQERRVVGWEWPQTGVAYERRSEDASETPSILVWTA